MSACKQWREALLDHALGQPPSASLQAHLRVCADCSAALRQWSAQAGQVDAVVRQMVTADSTPSVAERVLESLRMLPARRAPLLRWKLAAVLACVALLVALVYARHARIKRAQEAQLRAAATAIARWRSPTEDLLSSPSENWRKTVPRLGETFFELKPEMFQKE